MADDEVLEEAGCGRSSDPGDYAAELKRKLDLYCAAVAKTMEAKTQESSLDHSDSQASGTSQLIPQASLDANCGTSKEQSNDDDGDLEENTDPTNARRLRRMLSNRESARRSRKRRQDLLENLKSQVSMLTAENSSLLKRLADVTQKYKEATIDNKNLSVDVQMMRRKVYLAEEAVRRVTGKSLVLLSTTSDMPGSDMPIDSYLFNAAFAEVSIEESMNNVLQAPPQAQDGQTEPDHPNAAAPNLCDQ